MPGVLTVPFSVAGTFGVHMFVSFGAILAVCNIELISHEYVLRQSHASLFPEL